MERPSKIARTSKNQTAVAKRKEIPPITYPSCDRVVKVGDEVVRIRTPQAISQRSNSDWDTYDGPWKIVRFDSNGRARVKLDFPKDGLYKSKGPEWVKVSTLKPTCQEIPEGYQLKPNDIGVSKMQEYIDDYTPLDYDMAEDIVLEGFGLDDTYNRRND